MQYNKILALGVALCLLESGQVLAASANSDTTNLQSTVQGLSTETQALEQEVKELKSELTQVKRSKPAKQVVVVQKVSAAPKEEPYQKGSLLTAEQLKTQEQEADINYLIGSTVLSSPVLNIHSAYDASDLIVNQSTMNEDLRFLLQRETLREFIGSKIALPSTFRPRVFISGKVESQFTYLEPFGGPNSSAINLSAVELDVLAEASSWAYGFMSINFDNNAIPIPAIIGSGNPVNNSRLFLKRGFVTIGNLDRSPVYFSMGQMYVPFGDYSSYLLDNPVTLSEGRINARSAVLGFYKNGLYLSAYALNGAVNTESGYDANHVYEWGTNAGYKYSNSDASVKTNIGVGEVNNIAEAQGYQFNGLGEGSFQGFSARPDTEILQHPVPGFDAHASANLGPWSLYSEFVMATEPFAEQDLAFNDHGAEPKALHLEVDYTFNSFFNKQVALFMAGDHTWQSLALNLPESSAIVGLSTSIWKNTIESIEYRHDWNYSTSDTAGGICDPNDDGTTTFCPVTVTGTAQDSVIAQVGVYF